MQQGIITVEDTLGSGKKTYLNQLRARIGRVFQNVKLFPHMSVLENLKLGQNQVLGTDAGDSEKKARALLNEWGSLIMPLNYRVSYQADSSNVWPL